MKKGLFCLEMTVMRSFFFLNIAAARLHRSKPLFFNVYAK